MGGNGNGNKFKRRESPVAGRFLFREIGSAGRERLAAGAKVQLACFRSWRRCCVVQDHRLRQETDPPRPRSLPREENEPRREPLPRSDCRLS